jgi:hypothetical protein
MGTYLRIDGKDFEVCNYKMADRFEDRARVDVAFERITTCGIKDDRIRCAAIYPSEGLIKIHALRASR